MSTCLCSTTAASYSLLWYPALTVDVSVLRVLCWTVACAAWAVPHHRLNVWEPASIYSCMFGMVSTPVAPATRARMTSTCWILLRRSWSRDLGIQFCQLCSVEDAFSPRFPDTCSQRVASAVRSLDRLGPVLRPEFSHLAHVVSRGPSRREQRSHRDRRAQENLTFQRERPFIQPQHDEHAESTARRRSAAVQSEHPKYTRPCCCHITQSTATHENAPETRSQHALHERGAAWEAQDGEPRHHCFDGPTCHF